MTSRERQDTIRFWKASEFRTFVLYYFPLLGSLLSEPFFSHFSKLSYALSILLQESVSTRCVIDAGVVLEDFVKEVKFLYGQEHVTYNIHLLTHLSKSVLDWGCLWATSAFIPEWFNGQLQSLSHGTQSVVEQMSSNFLMQNSIRNQAISLLENQTVSPSVSKLLRQMICLPNSYEFKNYKCMNVEGNMKIKLLGKQIERKLSLVEQTAIENFLLKQDDSEIESTKKDKIINITENEPCCFYPRLKLPSSSAFTTKDYVRSKKRINYCALLQDSRFFSN